MGIREVKCLGKYFEVLILKFLSSLKYAFLLFLKAFLLVMVGRRFAQSGASRLVPWTSWSSHLSRWKRWRHGLSGAPRAQQVISIYLHVVSINLSSPTYHHLPINLPIKPTYPHLPINLPILLSSLLSSRSNYLTALIHFEDKTIQSVEALKTRVMDTTDEIKKGAVLPQGRAEGEMAGRTWVLDLQVGSFIIELIY